MDSWFLSFLGFVQGSDAACRAGEVGVGETQAQDPAVCYSTHRVCCTQPGVLELQLPAPLRGNPRSAQALLSHNRLHENRHW